MFGMPAVMSILTAFLKFIDKTLLLSLIVCSSRN